MSRKNIKEFNESYNPEEGYVEVYKTYDNFEVSESMVEGKNVTKEEVFEHISDLDATKAIAFYFTKLNEKSTSKNLGFYGSLNLHLKTIMINPKNKDGSLEQMSIIEESDRFSHWAGSFKEGPLSSEVKEGKLKLALKMDVNKSIELYNLLEISLLKGDLSIEFNRIVEDILMEEEEADQRYTISVNGEERKKSSTMISESNILTSAKIISEYVYTNYRDGEPSLLINHIITLYRELKDKGNLDSFNKED